MLTRLYGAFDAERRKRDAAASTPRLSTEQLQQLAQAYYNAELMADERERLNGLPTGFTDLFRERGTALLRRDLGQGRNSVHVHHEADRIMKGFGFAVRPPEREDRDNGGRHPYVPDAGENTVISDADAHPVIRRDSPAYRELCMWLMRAKVEAGHRFAERDEGDFTGKPNDPILSAPAPARIEAARDGGSNEETLAELHKRYLAERRDISEEWRRTNAAIMRLFINHVGARKPVAEITKRDVRAWKADLLKLPSRATLSKPEASMAELIRANAEAGKPTLSARTLNKYLSAVGAFMDWCERNDLISSNPAKGHHLADEDKSDKRDPFTTEQLNKLFKSSLFTGCLSDHDGDLHKPGNARVRDHRYWLWPLGLLTGCRLGELVQLTTEDVQETSGVAVLNVNTIGGKTLKTKSSRRIVPIHDELRRLGFLAYVDQRRATGGGRIFPEIRPDLLGRLATDPSKFFTKYLRRVGIKTDARLTFHSLRHSLADALRLAGHSDGTVGVILGHAKSGVTAGYGSLGEFPPAQRHKIINSAAFPGLEISHLYL